MMNISLQEKPFSPPRLDLVEKGQGEIKSLKEIGQYFDQAGSYRKERLSFLEKSWEILLDYLLLVPSGQVESHWLRTRDEEWVWMGITSRQSDAHTELWAWGKRGMSLLIGACEKGAWTSLVQDEPLRHCLFLEAIHRNQQGQLFAWMTGIAGSIQALMEEEHQLVAHHLPLKP